MRKYLLLGAILLASLLHVRAYAQSPAPVDCAPATPCSSTTGPSNTGTGYAIWKGFGVQNENWAAYSGCAIAGSTSGQMCMSNGSSSMPTFQSGTALSGLSAATSIGCTDLYGIQPGGSGAMKSATACLVALFVATDPQGTISGTSMTPDCGHENNSAHVTTATGTFTFNNPTGCTAADMQKILLHVRFDNSQTLAFGTAYHASTAVPLPTSAAAGTLVLGYRWDALIATPAWDYLAGATGF